MSSGMTSAQPEVARGTMGRRLAKPIASRTNPTWMTMAGRRLPERLPASSATANMLSDSGASDSPARIASYSSTICRKIGSAIIVPPRAICCII